MKIELSNIVTAFQTSEVIGSKVTNEEGFMRALLKVVEAHDFAGERIPGQGFVHLGDAVNDFVSAGVGKRQEDPDCYHVQTHRDRCSIYLKRGYAEPVTGCACVVYTMEAYVKDPEVDEAEVSALEKAGATHVLVAVLAFAGPQSELSPLRFSANLAGGNREALAWTADEIRAKAKAVMDYDSDWCPVADPVV